MVLVADDADLPFSSISPKRVKGQLVFKVGAGGTSGEVWGGAAAIAWALHKVSHPRGA